MTIEKLPSGSYRITQQEHGHRYRITVDHKPTNAEAARLISEALNKAPNSPKLPFKDAGGYYIESRLNVISPSTERGYRGIIRNLPEWFAIKPIRDITARDIQLLVNECAASHSPKTVRNLSGFVSAVLKYHGIQIDAPTLPQKKKQDTYIPTAEDVKKIFSYLKGTEYEVPIMLAAMGLRRSEICALELDDLEGNTLHITKALVEGPNGFEVKTTKTTESTRDVVIPEYLAELIRKQGFVYEQFPSTIGAALKRAQEALNLPHFSLHKLRHYFASRLHDKGLSDANIQALGGWKTDAVMKAVYRHAMEQDEARQQAAEIIGADMI